MTDADGKSPRFSLLTALLITTIAGLVIVVAQLWREVGPLRAEVRRLRDEVGELSISDPSLFHAIEVRTDDRLTWKWRVWIPEGRSYVIKMASDRIPAKGFPPSNGSISLGTAGEHWIQYRIRWDSESEQWMDELSTANASTGSSPQDWVSWPRKTSRGEGIQHTTMSFKPDEVTVLSRHRVSQQSTSTDIADPSAGFMVWMEPRP